MELLRQGGGLDQLADWTPELARKFERQFMEYHDIFSLDKNEMGCKDAAEHIIELLDEEPFKERFQQIAPPTLGRGPRTSPRNAGQWSHSAFAVHLV